MVFTDNDVEHNAACQAVVVVESRGRPSLIFAMVNESTKEAGKQETTAEGAAHLNSSPDREGKVTASEETVSESVNTVDKSHGANEHDGGGQKGEETANEKTNGEEPVKRSRGRPRIKKTDSSEPPVKKAKKERSSPARTSARVKNQKAGKKLENAEELPERKRSPTKRAAKNGVEQNGAAAEV